MGVHPHRGGSETHQLSDTLEHKVQALHCPAVTFERMRVYIFEKELQFSRENSQDIIWTLSN